jgi:predicted phosphoribosyltransferase
MDTVLPTIENALNSLEIKLWRILGAPPTNEADFNSRFEKEMSLTDGVAVYSHNPSDFGVTWSQVKTALDTLQAEYDAQAYARSRKIEYDALNQLELMTDDAINGTTTHLDAINAIKAKYPKPE